MIHINVQHPIGVPRRHGVDIIVFYGHRIAYGRDGATEYEHGHEHEHISSSAVPVSTASSDGYCRDLFNHDKKPSR
jgi:hypothetical protein